MTGNIAILADVKEGRVENITYQMLAKAREVADRLGGKVSAIVLGYGLEAQATQFLGSGVDEVILADHPALKYHSPELYVGVIQLALEAFRPALLLLGHTYMGIELASILAERLKASLATNCMDLTVDEGKFKVVRPACNGKLKVEAKVEPSSLTIITVQSGAIPASKLSPRLAVLRRIDVEERLFSSVRSRFLDIVVPDLEDVDISKAEVIVTVGRGIHNKENLKLAEELAKTLGGVLACSRPIADLGWMPETRVVGTSGKTVKPRLYVAFGVSGALQHIVGMKEAEVIVAINKDPNAPIFKYAQYGIVDDMFKVLPVLIEEVKKLKEKTGS